jgi:hypothetical protein
MAIRRKLSVDPRGPAILSTRDSQKIGAQIARGALNDAFDGCMTPVGDRE